MGVTVENLARNEPADCDGVLVGADETVVDAALVGAVVVAELADFDEELHPVARSENDGEREHHDA
jgi:hypothetical protein